MARKKKTATEEEVLAFLTDLLRAEEEQRPGEKFKAAELLCKLLEKEKKQLPAEEERVVIIDDVG